ASCEGYARSEVPPRKGAQGRGEVNLLFFSLENVKGSSSDEPFSFFLRVDQEHEKDEAKEIRERHPIPGKDVPDTSLELRPVLDALCKSDDQITPAQADSCGGKQEHEDYHSGFRKHRATSFSRESLAYVCQKRELFD
ncbi:MAG TPA: hypothetical protein VD967_02415, partial [Candidatus Paceibacterota bacterium]|nr:hypothetical protein [Candidatus Paceibacterota bacterium]